MIYMLRWSTNCRMSIFKIKSPYRHWSLNGQLKLPQENYNAWLQIRRNTCVFLIMTWTVISQTYWVDLCEVFINTWWSLARLTFPYPQHVWKTVVRVSGPTFIGSVLHIAYFTFMFYIYKHIALYTCAKKQFWIEKCIILFQKLKLFNTSNVAYA